MENKLSDTMKTEPVKPEAEPKKPQDETDTPEAEVKKPQVETEKPQVETKKPQAEAEKNAAEANKPQAETKKPQTETKNPQAETKNPQAETEKPQTETEKPQTETENPKSEVEKTAAAPEKEDSTGDTPKDISSTRRNSLQKTDLMKAVADKRAAEKKISVQDAEDQDSQEKESSGKENAETKSTEKKSTEKKSSEKKSSEKKSSEKKSAGKKTAGKKTSDKGTADKKTVKMKTVKMEAVAESLSENKQAGKKAAEKKTSDKKASDKKSFSLPVAGESGQAALIRILSTAGWLLLVICPIPLTAIIGDEGNNYFSCAVNLCVLVMLLVSFGLPSVISRMAASRLQSGDTSGLLRFLYAALIMAALLSAVGALFLRITVHLLAGGLLRTGMAAFALKALIPALIITALLCVIGGFFNGTGHASGIIVIRGICRVLTAGISVGAAWILYRYGALSGKVLNNNTAYGPAYGAMGAVLGLTAGAGICLIVMVIMLVRNILQLRQTKSAPAAAFVDESYKDIIQSVFTEWAPSVILPAICALSLLVDQAMFKNVAFLQGFTQDQVSLWWGVYSGKYMYPVGLVILVTVGLACHSQEALGMRIISALAFPCTVFLAFLGRPLILLLFPGSAGTASLAGMLLRIGAVAGLLYAQAMYSIIAMIKKGHWHNAMIFTGGAAILHAVVLVLLLLILRINIYAVVISNLVSSLLLCGISTLTALRAESFPADYGRTYLIPAAGSVMASVTSFILYHVLYAISDSTAVSFCAALMIALILYTVIFLLMKGMSEKDFAGIPGGNFLAAFFKKVHLL